MDNKKKTDLMKKKYTQADLNEYFEESHSLNKNNPNYQKDPTLRGPLIRTAKRGGLKDNNLEMSNNIKKEVKETNIVKSHEPSQKTSAFEIGKNWTSLENGIGHINKKNLMIYGMSEHLEKILRIRKISNSFNLRAKDYNREKFLELIESKNSDVVVFFHGKYYNFIDLSESCRILNGSISIFQNNDNMLLCKNSTHFVLIAPMEGE